MFKGIAIAILGIMSCIVAITWLTTDHVYELKVVVFHYAQIDENDVETIILHEMIISRDQVDTKIRQEIDHQAQNTLKDSNTRLFRIRIANAILRAPANNPKVKELVGDKWTVVWPSSKKN